jgi:hypothetical protein
MALRASFLCTLVLSSYALLGTGCEAVADFDPKKLEQDRTVGPVPLPTLDGATANVPDAQVGQDGALIRPEESDAGPTTPMPERDAGDLDANVTQDDASADDAGQPVDGGGADSGNDAAGPDDISFADAGP